MPKQDKEGGQSRTFDSRAVAAARMLSARGVR